MGTETYDTHHVVPVSIGGSDENKNIIKVPRQQHALYHQLFNNYHPSSIIRFLFSRILPLCFNLKIDISLEPYSSFIRRFDENMLTLWNNNQAILIQEDFEKIKAIIPFESYSRKKEEKIAQFKNHLYQFCTYHQSFEWNASGLFEQICHWCKIDTNSYSDVLIELQKAENRQGH